MIGGGKSILAIQENVHRLINDDCLNQALGLIKEVVELVISEPLCVSQTLASSTLDDLCQAIGYSSFLETKQFARHEVIEGTDQLIYVYIVTKLQKSGGHTQIIKDFINARPDGLHIILSTELAGRSDPNSLSDGVGKHANITFEKAPKKNYQQRLIWLQTRLLSIQSEKVYLFNHHQDSVAAAAIQPEMNLDAYFYHHGDHHLCLGVHLSHLNHIDIHPMGYQFCRNELGIKNSYIPLTVHDKGARPAEWQFCQDGGITTCTAGRSNKIELPYFVSYMDMVPKILTSTGGRHVHIGWLSSWALFKIRRGLKRAGILGDRFIYTPWVPSVWKALHDYRVDLYIASFPYGGGLTLIEAMGAGVPVALHRHIFSKLLSGVELAYPGAFSWRSPDELLGYCSSLTPEGLNAAGALSRRQYERYHTGSNLRAMLDGEVVEVPTPNDLSDDFVVQRDEWALWMAGQVNLRGVLSRVLYRFAKRVRNLF